jgi:hypothetical protein
VGLDPSVTLFHLFTEGFVSLPGRYGGEYANVIDRHLAFLLLT